MIDLGALGIFAGIVFAGWLAVVLAVLAVLAVLVLILRGAGRKVSMRGAMVKGGAAAGLLVGAFAVYVLTSFYGEFRDYTHQRAAEKHQPAPAGKRP